VDKLSRGNRERGGCQTTLSSKKAEADHDVARRHFLLGEEGGETLPIVINEIEGLRRRKKGNSVSGKASLRIYGAKINTFPVTNK